MDSDKLLVDELVKAIKCAFTKLFAEKPNERFYYCALVTHNCEGRPFVSAWSEEALKSFLLDNDISEEEANEYKWAYPESPYVEFGLKYFEAVEKLFSDRPSIFDESLSDEEAETEFQDRLAIMENAIQELDKEGFWGIGEKRDNTIATVVVAEDDVLSVEIARRLNPPRAVLAYSNWSRY